jgi:hypothetical protein
LADEASNLSKILDQIENLIALFGNGTKGVLEEIKTAFMRLVKLGIHIDDSLSCSMQRIPPTNYTSKVPGKRSCNLLQG